MNEQPSQRGRSGAPGIDGAAGAFLPPAPTPGSWNALDPPGGSDLIVNRPPPYVPPSNQRPGSGPKLLIVAAVVAGLALSITALVFL
ncbi:MAG TPA: hypothetical protein PLV68_19485, partial [Ilumatobacteraceae bacterium]|nr:hypothetical protein [Ilumatobacteraceae bacterium]